MDGCGAARGLFGGAFRGQHVRGPRGRPLRNGPRDSPPGEGLRRHGGSFHPGTPSSSRSLGSLARRHPKVAADAEAVSAAGATRDANRECRGAHIPGDASPGVSVAWGRRAIGRKRDGRPACRRPLWHMAGDAVASARVSHRRRMRGLSLWGRPMGNVRELISRPSQWARTSYLGVGVWCGELRALARVRKRRRRACYGGSPVRGPPRPQCGHGPLPRP